MDGNGRGDWSIGKITRTLGLPAPAEWPEGMSQLFHGDAMQTAPPDSALRDLGCVRCQLPLLDEPFNVWTLVSPYPCERSGDHLISVSAALHARCADIEPDELGLLIRDQSQSCFRE